MHSRHFYPRFTGLCCNILIVSMHPQQVPEVFGLSSSECNMRAARLSPGYEITEIAPNIITGPCQEDTVLWRICSRGTARLSLAEAASIPTILYALLSSDLHCVIGSHTAHLLSSGRILLAYSTQNSLCWPDAISFCRSTLSLPSMCWKCGKPHSSCWTNHTQSVEASYLC